MTFNNAMSVLEKHPCIRGAVEFIADLGKCPADRRETLKAALVGQIVKGIVGMQVVAGGEFSMPNSWSYDVETTGSFLSSLIVNAFRAARVTVDALRSKRVRIHIANDKLVVVSGEEEPQWLIGMPVVE